MNKKFRTRALAAIVTAGAISTQSFAAPVLDQTQADDGASVGIYNTVSRAQVFTAGLSGLLTFVELNFYWGPGDGDLLLSLYKAPGGKPEETTLFTRSFDRQLLPRGWLALNVASQNFFVEAGTQYAFGLQTRGARESWTMHASLSSKDPYASGRTFWRDSTDPAAAQWTALEMPFDYGQLDLQFNTWVDTDAARRDLPEPGSLGLAFGAVAALGAARRRAPRRKGHEGAAS